MPAPEFEELPDAHLKAIATVVVKWNLLEWYLNLTLMHLHGKGITENSSHILFAHMAFPQKLDIMVALAEEAANIPQYSEFSKCKDTLLPLLTEAQRLRNQVVHSSWGIWGTRVFRASLTARRKFKFDHQYVTLEEVNKAAVSIQTAIDAVYDLGVQQWREELNRERQRRKEDNK